MIKTIGIVGGGQLGRMMMPSIKELGLEVAVLDPDADAPCKNADHHVIADFNDPEGYDALARLSDVITYEFEHINVDLLRKLEREGHRIFPSVESLAVIQDKYTQKQALQRSGIAVPPFFAIRDLKDLVEYWHSTQQPFMLKSRRGGYDGKGNYVVRDATDVMPAFEALSRDAINGNDLMVEPMICFEKEVSVIATRGQDGNIAIYPIAENVHKNSILDTTTVHAAISPKTTEQAIDTAKRVMECFQGIGTFCTELFVVNEDVLVNEVAPRVHNSGHYTIEACRTSQFANHVRAVAGLPLGSPEMLVECVVMKNIIGGARQNGQVRYTGIEDALRHKNVNVHIYGKANVKEGRKMGHITITGQTEEVRDTLSKINVETST